MKKHDKLFSEIVAGRADRNVGFAELKMQTDPRYEVIIYWSEEDGVFIAEVPELPGCMADGPTYEGAVAAVRVVIREWIDTAHELGRQIPEPKGRLLYA